MTTDPRHHIDEIIAVVYISHDGDCYQASCPALGLETEQDGQPEDVLGDLATAMSNARHECETEAPDDLCREAAIGRDWYAKWK